MPCIELRARLLVGPQPQVAPRECLRRRGMHHESERQQHQPAAAESACDERQQQQCQPRATVEKACGDCIDGAGIGCRLQRRAGE
ncbi:MAG TPA: hypothetical protein VLK26_10140 [Rudaea sp.]|nr:hypothetical protein [Rudaea sp.]